MQYLQLFKKINFDDIDPNDKKFWMDHSRPTFDPHNHKTSHYRYVLTRPESGLRTFSIPERGHYIIDDMRDEDIAQGVKVESTYAIPTTRGFSATEIIGFLSPDGKKIDNPFYKRPEAAMEDKPEQNEPKL